MAAAITLINAATIGYMARREQSPTLRLWAWAWIAWAAAALTLIGVDGAPLSSPAFLLCGLLWVVSSLCFLSGTYELVARRMPRAWYAVASTSVVLALLLAVSVTSDRPMAMAPLVTFQSIAMLATGTITLRRMRGQAGAALYGVAWSSSTTRALGLDCSKHSMPWSRNAGSKRWVSWPAVWPTTSTTY